MAILQVGPTSFYPTIAAAMLAAVANDTIQLETGYSNETVTVTHTGMTIDGGATSTGIILQLGVGIAVFTTTGTAPFQIRDGIDGNGIVGNAGDNLVTVSGGVDAVDGGLGTDRLYVDYSLATGAVTGDSTSNFTEAGGGARSVTITAGTFEHFTVVTGAAADTITTGAGDDIINVGDGANTVTAGQGKNSITGGVNADTITAGDGGNFIDGGNGTNVLTSGAGDDTILSGTGADTIVAGAGADSITASGGADNVSAGPGSDQLTIDYTAMTTDVTGGITGGDLAGGYTGHLADLVTATVDFTGVERFRISTGSGNDNVTTGDGNDSINGGAGNDTLIGGDGADSIRGGTGNDSLDGGLGTDLLVLSGHVSDYTVTDNGNGTVTYVDLRAGSPDGTDITRGFEGFAFNNDPTGTVTINGTPESGHILLASNTLADADGLGTITYQWLANGTPIVGAVGSGFLLTPTQIGQAITVIASYTDGLGTAESAISAPTIAVAADITPPAALGTVTALSADTGPSSTDFVTKTAAQTVSGTYTGVLGTGETLQVSADGGATWVTATTLGATWSAAGITLSAGVGNLAVRSIDAANNAAAGTGHAYTLDTGSATVGTISATPANAVLGFGATASFTVTMSEAVIVNTVPGTPTLSLNSGATATYLSGSGTNTLNFSYTVAPGNPIADLAVSGLNLNGGQIYDLAGNQASIGEVTINPTGILRIAGIAGFDVTTKSAFGVVGQAYTGPVTGVEAEFISITADSLNIAAGSPNWFIRTGGGDDAISVSSGTNVLDGGTGSNFLTGGSGADTFFADNRAAAADTWNTLFNFGTGDTATIWGVTPADFTFAYFNNEGAVGYTGLTLHASAAGHPIASLTFVGYSTADITSGRISVTSGTDSGSGSTYTAFVVNPA